MRVTAVGKDTTFGRVVTLVEEAEQHRAPIRRVADKFAVWYLPVVVTVATGTFPASGKLLATTAVLVVACSFAIATPVAMIASIGTSARRGLLIERDRYLEVLAKATAVVLDKTGTLTLGRPVITDMVPPGIELGADEVLTLAATAERYSEHPLAEAVGGRRVLSAEAPPPIATELETQGKTLLFVIRNGRPVGVLAAMDTLRPDVPGALAELSRLGIEHLGRPTGDNERTAAAIAAPLGIHWRPNLLPADKIAVVKEYQRRGHAVVMIGDGVNDAPALAQADVGIALGAAGSLLAMEAAHIALIRDDWKLVPEVLRIARRTMNTVKINTGFTAVCNLAGLALAALGVLPPAIAAAAQAGRDFGILASPARLLRQDGSRQTTRSGRNPVLATLPKGRV